MAMLLPIAIGALLGGTKAAIKHENILGGAAGGALGGAVGGFGGAGGAMAGVKAGIAGGLGGPLGGVGYGMGSGNWGGQPANFGGQIADAPTTLESGGFPGGYKAPTFSNSPLADPNSSIPRITFGDGNSLPHAQYGQNGQKKRSFGSLLSYSPLMQMMNSTGINPMTGLIGMLGQ